MKGYQIVATFKNCECDPQLLLDYKKIKHKIINIIKKSGLKVMGTKFCSFQGAGMDQESGWSGTAVLAESHIYFHSYPEYAGCLVDIFVCHHTRNNTDKAEKAYKMIIDLFKVKKIENEMKFER